MKSFGELKKGAKASLGGAWGGAILLTLLPIFPQALLGVVEQAIRTFAGLPAFGGPEAAENPALSRVFANASIPSMVLTFLMGLLCFLLAAPLSQGVFRWFWRRGEPRESSPPQGGSQPREGIRGVFYAFETLKDYVGAVSVRFFVGIRMFFWTILLLLPPGAMLFFSAYHGFRTGGPMELGLLQPLGALLLMLWFCLAALLLKLASLRYFLSPYLRVTSPGERAGRLIRKGARLMAGRKGWLLLYQLSFLHWYLPALAAGALLIGGLVALGPALQSGLLLGALGMALVQAVLSCFYLTPYRRGAMCAWAKEVLMGEPEDALLMENVTREYLSRALEDSLGKLPEKPPAQRYFPVPEPAPRGFSIHYPPLIQSEGEDLA